MYAGSVAGVYVTPLCQPSFSTKITTPSSYPTSAHASLGTVCRLRPTAPSPAGALTVNSSTILDPENMRIRSPSTTHRFGWPSCQSSATIKPRIGPSNAPRSLNAMCSSLDISEPFQVNPFNCPESLLMMSSRSVSSESNQLTPDHGEWPKVAAVK